MNDFDKIFSNKLHNHKTPPPANGWDQLNAALDNEQRNKKKVMMWRVAAAILLLLLVGFGWWNGKQQNQEPVIAEQSSEESQIQQKSTQETRDDKSDQLALQHDLPSSKQTEGLSAEKFDEEIEKMQSPAVEEKSPTEQSEKKPRPIPSVQDQALLASTDADNLDKVEVQPIEKMQSVETLAVEPIATVSEELLAMEPEKTNISVPVTIIFKPGVDVNEDKNIAKEILSDLKNTSISFSDIRNAKAELLAKVFSKKENEVTP